MKIYILLLFLCINNILYAQQTPYEKNGRNYTATYQECIDYYQILAKQYKGIQIKEAGLTDAGLPLHVVKINAENKFNSKQWQQKNKCVLLINNGIHPGEPDGIDASMMLARSLVQQIKSKQFSNNICVVIIPIYNIGGMLNRSPYYRVDQDGPEEFGSRGNSQNLDLNRDFIKCDSKEAVSFIKIFQEVQPHIFLDNHVSDGADYPYTMTMATTQKDKLGGVLSNYLTQQLEPAIYKMMQIKKWPMIPYVNVWGKDAKSGWTQFFDSPRYSSGYATLFNTLAFVPETHMLKPYPDRVTATLALMETFINYATAHAEELVILKKSAQQNMLQQQNFPISWSNSKDSFTTFSYNGYAYKTKKSEVSQLPINYYDRTDSYTVTIPFYNYYKATNTVQAPQAYIISQAWHKVINLLLANNIQLNYLPHDTLIAVQYYHIDNYKASNIPYEGHHANSQINVSPINKIIPFKKGDVLINTQQLGKRFLVETLEPHTMDSYFTWNFFDAMLNQKEGYTDYAYEQKAGEYLQAHPSLKDSLVAKQLSDTTFAKDADAQLDFIYKHSPYYEPQHNRYPVYRLITENFNGIQIKNTILDSNKRDE